CLRDVSVNAIPSLAKFVGTQSLSLFPEYRIVRKASRALSNISSLDFPPPQAGVEYGVVGIIDTGTDPNNTHLQAWVTERFDFVPRDMQNNKLGSSVAGLLVHGKKLDHDNHIFRSVSS